MQFLIAQWLHWLQLFFSRKAVADRLQYMCDRGFTSVWPCGIQLRMILQEMFKISILDTSLKSTDLTLQPHPPWSNELICIPDSLHNPTQTTCCLPRMNWKNIAICCGMDIANWEQHSVMGPTTTYLGNYLRGYKSGNDNLFFACPLYCLVTIKTDAHFVHPQYAYS